jgi:RNase P/RNase MRP subunit POP5
MCILQIFVQCHDRFFEVLQEEVESTEAIVEDAISQVLLDLFGEVSVDDVAIRFSSDLRMGLQHCSIQIQAQCSYQSFALFPRTKELIEHTVEKRISLILKELFGSVTVDSVTITPFSTESQKRYSFPS